MTRLKAGQTITNQHTEFEEYANQLSPPGLKRASSEAICNDLRVRLTKVSKACDLNINRGGLNF